MDTIIYANSEHDRDDLAWPLRADRWMWSAGNIWCAVIAAWHTDWWEGGDPDDIAVRPDVWSVPIHEIPTTGRLSYTDASGKSVERPAPRRSAGVGATVARALAATDGESFVDIRVLHTPGREEPLRIAGASREDTRAIEERLRAAFAVSGYWMPAGGTIVTASTGAPALAPGRELALACAVLAADGQLNAERLATHALHGELCHDASLRPTAEASALSRGAYHAGASALLAPVSEPTCGPPLHTVTSLREAIAVLEHGPLPARCPACGSVPQVLCGEELVELRNDAPDSAPAHDACCDDEPGWRCANVNCTHFACYFPGPLSTARD